MTKVAVIEANGGRVLRVVQGFELKKKDHSRLANTRGLGSVIYSQYQTQIIPEDGLNVVDGKLRRQDFESNARPAIVNRFWSISSSVTGTEQREAFRKVPRRIQPVKQRLHAARIALRVGWSRVDGKDFGPLIDPILALGYMGIEARFLFLGIALGGQFNRRRFKQSVGYQTGNRSRDFVQKLVSSRLARVTLDRHGRQAPHVHFRHFHVADDDESNRKRSAHQPRAIIARPMAVDFALAHSDRLILASAYTSGPPPAEAWPRCQPPRTPRDFPPERCTIDPALCSIDDGSASGSAFETHLRRALPLFESVGPFIPVYVAARPHQFSKAEAGFRRFDFDPSGSRAALGLYRFPRHFAGRQHFENRRTRGFDERRLDLLREDRDPIPAPPHEAGYHDWLTSGDDAYRPKLRTLRAALRQLATALQTHVSEHDHQVLDTLRAANQTRTCPRLRTIGGETSIEVVVSPETSLQLSPGRRRPTSWIQGHTARTRRRFG